MFNSRKANMVMALILSIALWCYVVYTVNPVQSQLITGIPVQFENEQVLNERGLSIANTSEVTVDLSIEGARQIVAGIDKDDFSAVADVSECVSGDNIVEVNVECSKDVKRTSDATITVHIIVEPVVTVEKEIEVKGIEKDQETSDVIEYELTGSKSVSITGAKSLCENVDHVMAEVESVITSEEEILEVNLVPVDKSGKKVSNVNLLEKTASVKAVRYGIKDVSLKVNVKGEADDGVSFEGIDAPETVEIKGRHSIIDSIEEIEAGTIDISKMTKTQEISLAPKLPDGVYLADGTAAVTVTVMITDDGSSEIKVDSSSIEVTGLDEGLKAVPLEKTVNVSLYGEASAEDVKITADLSGFDKGEHEVELALKYSGSGKAELLTESIRFRIEEE